MSSTAELLELAERAVRAGGQAALRFFRTPLEVRLKGREPVTDADIAAHDAVVATLREGGSDLPMISEEAPDLPGLRADGGAFWVLDPVDGTVGFIKGEEDWATQLGLVVDGQVELGVVYCPARERLWRAARGGAAERIDASGAVVQIRASLCADFAQANLARSGHRPSSRVNRIASALGITNFFSMGGAGAKAVKVAEGGAELYLVTGEGTKIWDLCAPEAIVSAAGGRITDLRGQPLVYTTSELGNLDGVLVSNGVLHDEALTVAARIMSEA